MAIVNRHVPPTTEADLRRAIIESQRYLHSLGITAWQDAWIEASDDAAYLGLVERGELTARVVGSMWWDRLRGLEQVEEMVARRDRGPAGRYATTSVKLMLDGVCENFTGALLEPYLGPDGRPTGNSGIDFIEPAVLAEAVTRIDAAGMQPHFHAIGDRAVRSALDAVEAARRTNGPSDTRPHVAHIQLIHPDDLPRFRQVGLVADMQPYWACHEDQMDVLTVPFIGPERTGWQYPFASLRRAGARLCGGSDWPVSTPDPFKEIEVAVERILDETRDREPFLPEERLTLQDGLEAYTISSAYVNHLDDRTGSLEVGKMADLVVVDRDLFAPDAGPIGDARVQLTLVEGVSVHDSADLGG
jgi:predicted amidohydrolase YtcJ